MILLQAYKSISYNPPPMLMQVVSLEWKNSLQHSLTASILTDRNHKMNNLKVVNCFLRKDCNNRRNSKLLLVSERSHRKCKPPPGQAPPVLTLTWRHEFPEGRRYHHPILHLVVLQNGTYRSGGGTHCGIEHVNIISLNWKQMQRTS